MNRRLGATTCSIIGLAAAVAGCAANGAITSDSVADSQIDPSGLPLVHETDERFQSFQIGMSHLTGGETWRTYDGEEEEGAGLQPENFQATREARDPANLGNPKLRTLAAGLGPFYIRYGGTTSNSVYFQNDDKPRLAKVPEGFQTILTRERWRGALDFANAVDAKVVTGFTVSPGVRDADGVWTAAHARPWLDYTRSIGGAIYAAELINEPNAREPGHREEPVSAAEYARDFAIFEREIGLLAPDLKVAGPGTAMLGIAGPVVALDSVTAEDYVTAEPKPKLDIISYHFYGALAERCAPTDSPMGIGADRALSEEWLSRPDGEFQKHKRLRDEYYPGAPIWLTETGAAACGGTRFQPTFLDSFRFVDTQARLAKQGLDVLITHALISGSNGIIDENTLDPNASYWSALLWRRFMGSRVLDAGKTQPGFHLYAHCQYGLDGGVTLLAINMREAPASIAVAGQADVYSLTAPEMESRTVALNGKPLALKSDTQLPDLVPVKAAGGRVSLPPSSINFIIVPNAANAACAT